MRAYQNAVITVVALAAPAAAQVYVPIPVIGYTKDVIADATGTPSGTTTAAFDGGVASPGSADDNVYFAQGYNTGGSSNGLPPSGLIVSSANRTYQLGPVSGNNSLRITNSTGSGTLNLTTPARDAALSLLLASGSGGGSSAGNVTVNWSDGQSSSFSYRIYDWWQNGPTSTNAQVAVGGLDRVDRQTGVQNSVDLSLIPPPTFAIYYYDIDLTGDANYQSGAMIDSLTFPWPSGAGSTLVLNVMGLSGATSVPEPSGLFLFGAAMGFALWRRRIATAV
jgi:hypothetical protein